MKDSITSNALINSFGSSSSLLLNQRKHLFDKQVKILHIVTLSFIGFSTLIYIGGSTRQCIQNRYEIKPLDFVLGGIIYMVISLTFLATGILMLKATRDHYEKFYSDYGAWIWISTFALSIPMMFRSINLFMMS